MPPERPSTRRSLAYVFDWDPPSEVIAVSLNDREQDVCVHGRSPCFVFCGVQRHPLTGRWEPIAPERRAQWFGRFFGLLFRDREKEYDRANA